jgi:hypothetical protein
MKDHIQKLTIQRGGSEMDVIDVKDLPEKEANLVQQLVEALKEKARLIRPVPIFPEKEEPIRFGAWPLGVKGNVTREEIYDYL